MISFKEFLVENKDKTEHEKILKQLKSAKPFEVKLVRAFGSPALAAWKDDSDNTYWRTIEYNKANHSIDVKERQWTGNSYKEVNKKITKNDLPKFKKDTDIARFLNSFKTAMKREF